MNEFQMILEQIVKNLPKSAIKNGKVNEQLIEVVIRRSDGKISSIVKCALENGGKQKILSKVIKNVPVGAISGVGTISSLANNIQTEMVRREVKKVGKDVKEVLEITKNISSNVDKIAQGMSVVQSLSVLNAALSAVNIGVSVVGFAIMSKKLDCIKDEIYEIHKIVADIKDMKINEIINDGQELIDKSKGFYQRIDFGDATIKDYEYILGKFRNYIRNMRDTVLCGHICFEQGYSIIMGLLPIYLDLLKRYVVEVYYEKGVFPQSEYDTHIAVIQSLANQDFMSILFDYAFLEKNVSKVDAETATGIHLLTVGNVYTEIEDTKSMILLLPEKKDYMALEKLIFSESKRRLVEALPIRSEIPEYDRMELIDEINKIS